MFIGRVTADAKAGPFSGAGLDRHAHLPDRVEPLARTVRSAEHEEAARFEAKDVPPLLPLWLAVGLAAFIVAVLAVITLAFPLAVHQQYRGPMQPLPQAPRLQLAPGKDFERYQAAKTRELERPAPGQMPIEAAMRSPAAQGWGPPR
jgi:hypothetical protein